MFERIKSAFRPIFASKKGKNHRDRMENYYRSQAKSYDYSRKSFLQGRTELWKHISIPDDGVWLDCGCGTGFNLECAGEGIKKLSQVYAVDISPSMLELTQTRVEDLKLKNVKVIEMDVTKFEPETPLDLITFSYSLTMIPNWFQAIDQAYRLLKPGGTIAIVDFYVSRKHPEPYRKHRWSTRTLGIILGHLNNVFISPDHLPYLTNRFETEYLSEEMKPISRMPFSKTPRYLFVGKTREA